MPIYPRTITTVCNQPVSLFTKPTPMTPPHAQTHHMLDRICDIATLSGHDFFIMDPVLLMLTFIFHIDPLFEQKSLNYDVSCYSSLTLNILNPTLFLISNLSS